MLPQFPLSYISVAYPSRRNFKLSTFLFVFATYAEVTQKPHLPCPPLFSKGLTLSLEHCHFAHTGWLNESLLQPCLGGHKFSSFSPLGLSPFQPVLIPLGVWCLQLNALCTHGPAQRCDTSPLTEHFCSCVLWLLGSHPLTTPTGKSHCCPFTVVDTEIQKVTCLLKDAQPVCAERGPKATILPE